MMITIGSVCRTSKQLQRLFIHSLCFSSLIAAFRSHLCVIFHCMFCGGCLPSRKIYLVLSRLSQSHSMLPCLFEVCVSIFSGLCRLFFFYQFARFANVQGLFGFLLYSFLNEALQQMMLCPANTICNSEEHICRWSIH